MRMRPFLLERYFAEHEFSAPFLLCSSDVEAFALDELLALADDESRELWERLTLGYTEAPGHPLLRAAIAELYDGLAPEDVLVFSRRRGGDLRVRERRARAGRPRGRRAAVYQSLYEVARARRRRGDAGRTRARGRLGARPRRRARALRRGRARSSSTSPTTQPARTSTGRRSTRSSSSPRRPAPTSSPTRSTAGSSTEPADAAAGRR